MNAVLLSDSFKIFKEVKILKKEIVLMKIKTISENEGIKFNIKMLRQRKKDVARLLTKINTFNK
jgi:hypothetical protein